MRDWTDDSVQNALPVWHTHSTVTGTATALGISNQARQAALQANGTRSGGMGDDEDEDDLLEAHYAQMDEDDEQPQEEEVPVSQVPTAPTSGESTPGVDSVMVMGKLIRLLSGR